MHAGRSSMVLSTLLLLFVTQACHAEEQTTTTKTTQPPQVGQLMCYVCEDCAKLPENAPLKVCDASYFDPGTTLPATQTTTDSTTIISTESEETTTIEIPTTTEMKTTETTTETTTPTTTTTTSSPTPPTPPTVGPPVTTSPVPTPPTPDAVAPPADVLVNLNGFNRTATATAPTTILVRQLRQAIDTSITYHCYSVVKKVNGTKTTERGCSKVTTDEAVCTQLAVLSPDSQLSNCYACTMNKCNGSSALGFSLLALIIGVLASLFYRN